MDIVSRMQNALPTLRPAEQKVAQYILDNLSFAASASINELALKIEVSQASITRLARALSCDNVRDMKLKIAQSAAVGARFIEEDSKTVKRPIVYQAIHDILDLNAGLITDDLLKKACDLVTQTQHVLLFGVGGGSTVMAQECHHRLFRLEIKSNAYSDPMLMRMSAATVNKGDVVIALSLSGESPDVLAATRIAQEYGAQIITICASGSLSTVADVHLPLKTQESDYIFQPSASRYVMLAAIDMLASEVAIRNQRKSREKLRRLKFHLDEHRHCSERLPLGD
ncbi:MurR/RpiR family transcriptional regulator [Paraglaciecola hydrolytica]|uniref:Transcriptional regulator n=1 Tax=Paraglaciecola hydrolytica TaxID=1799789 RepID=A0A136A4D2_9ALTE|nr:MurR/RpiR family transcriptional regulator [Paraglaciecola hydrolytica]KXI30081.1 transcriptional regulator [Paraglaciecola hydrolytica]